MKRACGLARAFCQATLMLPAALVLLVACQVPSRPPDQDFRNFQAAVARASKDGYSPYWLGRQFVADGLTFKGPASGDFGTEIDGGGTQFTYNAVVTPNGGTVGLRIILYSRPAWDKARAVQDVTQASPGIAVTPVTVAGSLGRLVETRNRLGTLEGLQLILPLGETTVLAIANRGTPLTPGPDLNPLTNKATFLAAMQNLRRYPD